MLPTKTPILTWFMATKPISYKPISYKPISGNDLPRFAGISTFMRLPQVNSITTYVIMDSPKNERG
jgi:hypothetical protein